MENGNQPATKQDLEVLRSELTSEMKLLERRILDLEERLNTPPPLH
jgi:hypothetical protein